MYVEEDVDLCLTNTDYSIPYPIDSNIVCPREESKILPDSTHTTTSGTLSKSYTSFNDLNFLLKEKRKGDLFALHLNAVSLVAHYDEIESLIDSRITVSPDILCISETRFKDSKVEYQAKLVMHPDYQLVYDNSPTNAGGVAIYVKSNIQFVVRRELRLKHEGCESLFIELDISENSIFGSFKKILIGCVYRHPKPNAQNFVDELSDLLDQYSQKDTAILLMGDINYDVTDKNRESTKYYENMLSSFGCSNLINISTRFGRSNSAILDHIITNFDEEKTEHGVLDFTMTDQLPIFAILKHETINDVNKKIPSVFRQMFGKN